MLTLPVLHHHHQQLPVYLAVLALPALLHHQQWPPPVALSLLLAASSADGFVLTAPPQRIDAVLDTKKRANLANLVASYPTVLGLSVASNLRPKLDALEA